MARAPRHLQRRFERLRSRGARSVPALSRVRLKVGPASEFTTARSFAYCTTTRTPCIVVAPDFADQDPDRQEGLLRHELAHAAAILDGVPEHLETDADRLAEALFGDRIYYDSDRVQTIAPRTGRRRNSPRRPRSLPNSPDDPAYEGRGDNTVQRNPRPLRPRDIATLLHRFPDGPPDSLYGYGAKTPNQIVAHIDKHSRTHLNRDALRRQVSTAADWFFLVEAPVSSMNAQTHGRVQPSGREDLSVPIVLGSNGEVIDGRHRVELARARGLTTLPAYVPAQGLWDAAGVGQIRANGSTPFSVDRNTWVRANRGELAPRAMEQLRERYIRHLTNRCGLDEKRAKKLVPRQFGRSPRIALTSDQLDAFNAAVRREVRYGPLAAALLLLPETGLRVSEIAELKITDVVTENGRTVLRVISEKSSKLRVTRAEREAARKREQERAAKGWKPKKPIIRMVPLYRKAQRILEDYLQNGRFGVREDSEFLFPGRSNGRISPATFRTACAQLVEREPRLPKSLTPHVLRHTFATERIKNCHDVETIQEHMGHKSRKTLFLYVHDVSG